MTDGWQIAVLGATGAVGEALLELLQEREFPVGELYLLASERSAGENIRFNGKSHIVQDAAEFDWSLAQMAFFVAGSEASLRYAQAAADDGCIVIDSSGIFALEPDVPLVVPGVNDSALSEYRNRNIISVAGSLTAQLLTAVKPLSEAAGLARLQATVMLAASSYGKAAVDELAGQSAKLLNGLPIEEGIFTRQLAFNLLPLMPDAEGSVPEERRAVDEVRKVLQDDTLPVSVSCVLSSVFYGHGQIVHFEGMREMSPEEATQALEGADDIQLSEEGDYPTQVGDATGNPHLSIGCLRGDYGQPERLQFWSVADNVRFGGALMAVKTAESLGSGVPVLMSSGVKIALGIEYDGSRYYGWQRQQEVASVQGELEKALSQVANSPVTVFCAGRTDAGVHATGQVVHFETEVQRKDVAWTLGVNANLPSDIAVRWVKNVEPDFHARFSATARRYRYIIYNHRLRPAILGRGVSHFHLPLDEERMHRAGQSLLGENDFTSFRAVQCQSRTPWRNVNHLKVTRHGPYVVVDIKANAFVHHMVRNIVGSLLEIGCGNQEEGWMAELLAAKDRTQAAATAKAEGLYLVSVDYPERFALPALPIGPLFLNNDLGE